MGNSVQLAAGRDVAGRVRNRDSQLKLIVITGSDVKCIIHIFGGCAVDSDKIQMGQISARQIIIRHGHLNRFRLFQCVLMAGQCHPPRRVMVIRIGDKAGDFRVEAAITL